MYEAKFRHYLSEAKMKESELSVPVQEIILAFDTCVNAVNKQAKDQKKWLRILTKTDAFISALVVQNSGNPVPTPQSAPTINDSSKTKLLVERAKALLNKQKSN